MGPLYVIGKFIKDKKRISSLTRSFNNLKKVSVPDSMTAILSLLNNMKQTHCNSKDKRVLQCHTSANFPINGAAAGSYYLRHDTVKPRDESIHSL